MNVRQSFEEGAFPEHFSDRLSFVPPFLLRPSPPEVPSCLPIRGSLLSLLKMRATTIISTFCVLACAIYSPASALPSNSGSLTARAPSPSIVARAPQPSSARRMEARAPMPSASLKKKREQHVIVSAEEQISRQLCPTPMSVCPITSARPSTLLGWIADGYECVDQQEDLTSCGGCGIVDTKYDCTAIEGADSVSCVVGSCRIDTCISGYSLALDGENCVRTL